MKSRPPGRLVAVLGGVLLSFPALAHAAPEAGHCDTVALEQALAATQRQVATLQATNQALTAEAQRLRAEPRAVQATIDSFVSRLFGQPADGNVAAAARAAALAELIAARASTPGDHRLRFAQRSFEQGEQAMRRQEPGRAVHEFRETYEMAVRIQGDRQRPPAPQVKKSD